MQPRETTEIQTSAYLIRIPWAELRASHRVARSHQQHVSFTNLHVLTGGRGFQLHRAKSGTGLNPLHSEVAGHIEQHSATDDAVLKGRHGSEARTRTIYHFERDRVIVESTPIRDVANGVHVRHQFAVIIQTDEILVHFWLDRKSTRLNS